MTTSPHDAVTTSPRYAQAYHRLIAEGATPEDAARRAYELARKAKVNVPVIVGVSIVAALVIALTGVAVIVGNQPTPPTRAADVQTVTSPEPPPPPSPEKYTPVRTDFELTVKITEKQCFGEAGCSITFRVDVAYGGLPLDEGDAWLVTYTVTGGDSGAQINSFVLQGTQVTQDSMEVMSTTSAKIVPKAVVTEIAPN